MKKITSLLLLSLGYCLFVACNTATPENYFEAAVLNSNMIVGFANDGLTRQLESPSVKLVEGTKGQTTPMKRTEIMGDKIEYLESAFEKVKQLKETEDTKDMLQASVALYEFVLPVYKKEYVELAKLYDDNVSEETIDSFTQSVHDKYALKFDELYNKLIAMGKIYASKHNIKVNWAS
jgi:hypothetical protein